MIMKLNITTLILFLSFLSFGQKIDKSVFLKMLKEVANNYSTESYELNFEQFIYADSLRKEIQNQNKTKMIKVSNVAYQIESPNILVVNADGIKLVLDSLNNEMFIFKGDTSNVALWTFDEPQFEKSIFYQYTRGVEKVYKAYINHPASDLLFIEYKVINKDLKEMNIQYKASNYMDLEDEENVTSESPFIRTVFDKPVYNFNKSRIISLQSIVNKNSSGKYEITDKESSFSLHDLRYQKN